MATKINARNQNSNCSVGAVIDNADGLKVNASLSWDYSLSSSPSPAPDHISATCYYYGSGQEFRDVRTYASDGSYNADGKISCAVFDTTFDNALKALVLDCFENYTNVSLVGEE